MGAGVRFAKACVRVWTWLYTCGLPASERSARRSEIESDLWEFECDLDADHPFGPTLHLLLRLLLGIPDDLSWRVEKETTVGTLTQEGVVLTGRAFGAALFLFVLFAIDADADRVPPDRHIGYQSAVVDTQIGEVMTMRPTLLHAGIAATVALSLSSPPPAEAQSSAAASGVAFEVASVRANTSGDRGTDLDSLPGGRLTGRNVTVGMLIRYAYHLPDFLTSGGPGWLDSDRFDVVAKAEGEASEEQKRLMMRRLLADRFKLVAHAETRELEAYTLTKARSDGKLGGQLRPSEGNCATSTTPSTHGIRPPGGPLPSCGFFGFAPGTNFPEARGGLAFRGLTMAALAKHLVPMLRRAVVDRTGLSGYFDGDFDFIRELPLPPPPPGTPNPFKTPFASVFAVFPEQLGLKIESVRTPIEVLVIDSVERPSPE